MLISKARQGALVLLDGIPALVSEGSLYLKGA